MFYSGWKMVFLLTTCLISWAQHEANLGNKTLILLCLFLRTMRKALKSVGLYSLSRFQQSVTFGTSRKKISYCTDIKKLLAVLKSMRIKWNILRHKKVDTRCYQHLLSVRYEYNRTEVRNVRKQFAALQWLQMNTILTIVAEGYNRRELSRGRSGV